MAHQIDVNDHVTFAYPILTTIGKAVKICDFCSDHDTVVPEVLVQWEDGASGWWPAAFLKKIEG